MFYEWAIKKDPLLGLKHIRYNETFAQSVIEGATDFGPMLIVFGGFVCNKNCRGTYSVEVSYIQLLLKIDIWLTTVVLANLFLFLIVGQHLHIKIGYLLLRLD